MNAEDAVRLYLQLRATAGTPGAAPLPEVVHTPRRRGYRCKRCLGRQPMAKSTTTGRKWICHACGRDWPTKPEPVAPPRGTKRPHAGQERDRMRLAELGSAMARSLSEEERSVLTTYVAWGLVPLPYREASAHSERMRRDEATAWTLERPVHEVRRVKAQASRALEKELETRRIDARWLDSAG